MLTIFKLCWCVLVIAKIGETRKDLIWKRMTSPVIFRQDVQLKCEFPSHIKCSGYSRTWTGGQRYALLTLNGVSSNDTKYQETKSDNCTYSVLTIKSFDQTDVDIVYKCTYGFSSYQHVLELKSSEYEYHPNEDFPIKPQIDEHFNLRLNTIFRKVFPKPICKAYINGKDVSSLLSINSRREIFYESYISFEYTNKERSCIETVKVSCRVGQTSFKVVDFVKQCRQSGSKINSIEKSSALSRGQSNSFKSEGFIHIILCMMSMFSTYIR